MRWFKAITYIFSPLVAALLAGILFIRLHVLGGTWFVIVVLIGLVVSLTNAVIVSMGMAKKQGN
ncbi:MAG: hypothetical protein KAS61_00110 [Spirochaetes bacterium]|nr:hypothetical protein [Spirochaetota bacterium]